MGPETVIEEPEGLSRAAAGIADVERDLEEDPRAALGGLLAEEPAADPAPALTREDWKAAVLAVWKWGAILARRIAGVELGELATDEAEMLSADSYFLAAKVARWHDQIREGSPWVALAGTVYLIYQRRTAKPVPAEEVADGGRDADRVLRDLRSGEERAGEGAGPGDGAGGAPSLVLDNLGPAA